MTAPKEREFVKKTAVYFKDQLSDFDILAKVKGTTRAALQRQSADEFIKKPEHQAIIKAHKKD